MLLSAVAVMTATGFCALAETRAVSDAEALAIARKHCVMCHAQKPVHQAFQQAPKDVALETVADLRKYTALIYLTTVENRSMPLGTQTHMTEAERAALGRWAKAAP